MGKRRSSRVLALQALYDWDINDDNPMPRFDMFCANFKPSKKAKPFLVSLIEGVHENKQTIDTMIERFSNNWRLSRMSCVDRNILRIAVYELLFCNDIPAKVTINEAIDIGKIYGTEESGAFINGILDSIHLFLKKNKDAPDE